MPSLKEMITSDPIHTGKPVPHSLDEVEDLDYLVNSCRLWREDGPIIEGFRKIIEQNRRGEAGR